MASAKVRGAGGAPNSDAAAAAGATASAASASSSSSSSSSSSASASSASGGEVKVVGLGLDEEHADRVIKLVSKDRREFEVQLSHALISKLVKTAVDTDPETKEVPVPGVHSDALARIVAYMAHHKGVEAPPIEKPLRDRVMRNVVKDVWDADFIDPIADTRQLLYDVILGANYLDINGLLHLGCAKTAALIKGQPLEKIKEVLQKGIVAQDQKDSKS